ncbi:MULTISPECIES: deoxynucleotide monophosphate kinase family protein [Streptomyces]|uniref:deoxynucleotide monophosphate kinase family protein n=1 Tax=Streptomyces TaxID=1883 RepID=UPI002E291A24|nr:MULTISPECIES: hypothetical protein [Streptomyces]
MNVITGTPTLIGFAGAARSGKDTAASVLVERGWQRRAFADKVRDMLYALDPVLIDRHDAFGGRGLRELVDAYGWEKVKQVHPEVRGYHQRLGTEGGREVLGQDVWVDALFRDLDTWRGRPTVVTDVRFPNEAEAIKSRGGLVVLLHRPGQLLIDGSDHVSENALGGWAFDATVINGGDIGSLRRSVISLTSMSTCD